MSIGDTLYAFTEWLRSTQLAEFSLWMGNTPVSQWIQSHFWAIPILQILHILALAAAFGSVLMLNLRILGLASNSRTMTQTARRYLPWIWWALLVLVVTGVVMIVGDPPRVLLNSIFWIKIGLVIFAVVVSLAFQASVQRSMAKWETTHDGRVAVRVGAVGIIILWCVIMFAGRWIAYAPS